MTAVCKESARRDPKRRDVLFGVGHFVEAARHLWQPAL